MLEVLNRNNSRFRTRNSKSSLRFYYPLASSPFPLVNHLMLKALSDIAFQFTKHNEIFLEWVNPFTKRRMIQRPQDSHGVSMFKKLPDTFCANLPPDLMRHFERK